MNTLENDLHWMKRALDLASQGHGWVEPNPMVGCVIVSEGRCIGQGRHEHFGQAHAEINALQSCEQSPEGATIYVNLEPCSHFGKTPPCCDALIAAGVGRVVVGVQDPFPQVRGRGIAALRAAGIEVSVGVGAEEAEELNRPFFHRCATQRPWVIAKWAMSLDGKIATVRGESQWISGEPARQMVHEWRGCMDCIAVGSQTALVDDPLLTARPPGPRVATRLVWDSQCRLHVNSKLVQTAREIPVLLICGPSAKPQRIEALQQLGVEVVPFVAEERQVRLQETFRLLGSRGMTHVLVEGGGELLGSLLHLDLIDETRVFIAPSLIGGRNAPTAVGGNGLAALANRLRLKTTRWQQVGEDFLLVARRATLPNHLT